MPFYLPGVLQHGCLVWHFILCLLTCLHTWATFFIAHNAYHYYTQYVLPALLGLPRHSCLTSPLACPGTTSFFLPVPCPVPFNRPCHPMAHPSIPSSMGLFCGQYLSYSSSNLTIIWLTYATLLCTPNLFILPSCLLFSSSVYAFCLPVSGWGS